MTKKSTAKTSAINPHNAGSGGGEKTNHHDKNTIHYQYWVGSNATGSEPRRLESGSYKLVEIIDHILRLKQNYPLLCNLIREEKTLICRNTKTGVIRQISLSKRPQEIKRLITTVAEQQAITLDFDISTQEGACMMAEHLYALRTGQKKPRDQEKEMMIDHQDSELI